MVTLRGAVWRSDGWGWRMTHNVGRHRKPSLQMVRHWRAVVHSGVVRWMRVVRSRVKHWVDERRFWVETVRVTRVSGVDHVPHVVKSHHVLHLFLLLRVENVVS